MAAIFGEGKIFCKLQRLHSLDTLWVENVDGNRSKFVFCHFWQNFKMAAIFGEGKIFGKLQRVHSLDTLWVENFDEIAVSRTV